MKNSTEKLLSEESQGLDSFILQAADLFMSGLHWLKVLSTSEHKIRFSQWAKLIRKARGNTEDVALDQLEWLLGSNHFRAAH